MFTTGNAGRKYCTVCLLQVMLTGNIAHYFYHFMPFNAQVYEAVLAIVTNVNLCDSHLVI